MFSSILLPLLHRESLHQNKVYRFETEETCRKQRNAAMRKTTVQEQPIKQIEKETWTNLGKRSRCRNQATRQKKLPQRSEDLLSPGPGDSTIRLPVVVVVVGDITLWFFNIAMEN